MLHVAQLCAAEQVDPEHAQKFRPKKMTMSPVTKLTTALYSCSSVPREPAKAPSSTNTSVKPRIKPRAFFTTRFVSLSLSPAK